jgi:uncharacterized protein YcbX
MSTPASIAEIRRYPVKSMQGELLTEATVDALGIAGDRRYAVRDLTTGKILSAKNPRVAGGLLACSARTEPGNTNVVVTVDGSDFAVDDPTAAAALSSLLKTDVHIEAATDAEEVYESYWPEIEGVALSDTTIDLPMSMSTEPGTFVDLAALHVMATGSLDHLAGLNAELVVTADRFRPSILIATPGASGFVEKDWVDRTANAGGATLSFGGESPRCIMTTHAQGELPKQKEILQTIARENRVEMEGMGAFACLGIYAEVTAGGTIAVGDQLTLTS